MHDFTPAPGLVATTRTIEEMLKGMSISGWEIYSTREIDDEDPEDVPEDILSIRWQGWSPYSTKVDVLIYDSLNGRAPQESSLHDDDAPSWHWATREDTYTPGIMLYAYFRDKDDAGFARLVDLAKLLSLRGDQVIADDFQVIIPLGDLDDYGDEDDEEDEDDPIDSGSPRKELVGAGNW